MHHWDTGERKMTEPTVGCGAMMLAGPCTRKVIPW